MTEDKVCFYLLDYNLASVSNCCAKVTAIPAKVPCHCKPALSSRTVTGFGAGRNIRVGRSKIVPAAGPGRGRFSVRATMSGFDGDEQVGSCRSIQRFSLPLLQEAELKCVRRKPSQPDMQQQLFESESQQSQRH